METTEKQCNRHQHNGHITSDTSSATKDEQKSFAEVVKGKGGNSEDHPAVDKGNKYVKEKNIDGRNGVKGQGGGNRRPRDTSTPMSIHSIECSTSEKTHVYTAEECPTTGNQNLSSHGDTTLSEFVQNLEEEKSKLENDSAESVDTSSLRMLLSDLSLALDDRHAESMKLCGDAEEVREKLEAVRKILLDQINRGEEDGEKEGNADSSSIKDNKLRESRAQASLSNAKAALARLALEVSETSQLAAEVELAAAQAAVMAEDAQKESAKTSDAMDATIDKTETDGEAMEEDDDHEEEEETEEDGGHPGESRDDGDEKRDKSDEEEEENSKDEDAKHETINDKNDDVDAELQQLGDETSAEVDEMDGSQLNALNEASRPSSTTSPVSNHNGRPKSGKNSQMLNETSSPSPRPTSSRRTPTEKPLEWPHYILPLSEDPDNETIGCIIRSNDDVIEDNPHTFICRLAPHLSTSVVNNSEELVSDVVVIEEATTEDDYSEEDENDGKEKINENDDEVEETTEETPEDGNGTGGEEQESKETENPNSDENNNTVTINDEQKEQKTRKEYRLVVAIPYTATPRMASSREFVVKMKTGSSLDWSILQTLATESVFPEHKGPFIETRVNMNSGAFAVVARPITDRLTITKKGGFLKSSTDSRISLSYPVGISSLMTASLQVQPAEQAVSELKERMKHCSDLITASPILHLTHSTQKRFEQPITLALSCPPNPFKVSSSLMASSKADEKQDRSDKSGGMPPSREDGVVIRSTKSSIFGGDPSEDALHLLHRSITAKSWATLDGIPITQTRKDVVSVDLDKPYDRLLVLRMTADCRYPVENVANTFEQALQIKYSKIILAHKVDDLEKAVVLCVTSRQVEGVLRKLASDGYEAPSEMSEELPLTEGMEIEMRVTGNIKVVNHKNVKMIFHSQRRTSVDLRLDVANLYGNYSSSDYRGMLEFYGQPKIVLHDMEDPEEILLREAEAKVEAKKGQSKEEKKEKKAKENKEQIQNVSKTAPDQLCKIPVSLPKRDRDVDLTASQTRAKIADVPGITCNINLEWLAGELGNEWESLAAYLGIKSNRIQSIKRNFPGKQTAQIFNMLITWRSRMPKSYDKERKLLRALTRCGRYDLSEELKYRDEEGDAEETEN